MGIPVHGRSQPMMSARPPMTALRQRMQDDLQLRNYSPQTIDCYLRCVAQFAHHFRTPPDRLGPEQIRQYHLYLVQDKHVSWLLVSQTVCALRFFYHITLGQPSMIDYIPQPKRPKTLPTVLSQAEVAALLQAPRRLKTRAILTTLYAAGLRVSELCQLQVTAIDSARMVLCIRQGKGQQDRYVMLSPKLLPLLRHYWQQHTPRPWLFPGTPGTRPITARMVHRICRDAGQAAHLPKAIHPHLLRHNPAYQLMLSSLAKGGGSLAQRLILHHIIRGFSGRLTGRHPADNGQLCRSLASSYR